MRTILYILLLPVLLLASSCIKTDTSDCVRFSLSVLVLDVDGSDITASGQAGDVLLYIFDGDLRYLDQVSMSAEDVVNGKKLKFNFRSSSNTLWVVAWSNLNGGQNVVPSVFTRDTHIESALVQLQRNAQGYAVNPDELFGSVSQVCGQCSNNLVVLEHKTALMSITAVGVPSNPVSNNYHFVLKGAGHDAFNFLTNLTGNPILYSQSADYAPQSGMAKAIQPLVITSQPFNVYPLATGERFVVEVYNGDELIATAQRDDQGHDIVPVRGQTLNILLNFGDATGPLEVTVKVTDWNDVLHWFVW